MANIISIRDFFVRNIVSQNGPGMCKCLFNIRYRRPSHFHSSIAPRFDIVLGIAHPHASNAQTSNEANFTVNCQSLTMIATEPSERRVEAWWVVTSHLNFMFAHVIPERA